MICPAGREAKLFGEVFFSQLRKAANIPDDFVNEGWSLDSLESGGAKGGCLMAFLGSEFVVKELNSGDHHSLLKITESYFEHVRDGDTMLGAILMHFEDLATGRRFFVMRNVLGAGPFLAKYDLKGCNDDKTLELFGKKLTDASMLISNAGRWCGYFGSEYCYDAFSEFSAGKKAASRMDLVVTEAQREVILRRLQKDTEWLTSHQLMDYSLIVGVKTGAPGFMADCPDSFVRVCEDGSEVAVCIGIIDFLQQWNLKKMVARTMKCLECNKATIPPAAYARRFCDYFEERFVCTTKVWEREQATEPDVTPKVIGRTHWKSNCIPHNAESLTEICDESDEEVDQWFSELSRVAKDWVNAGNESEFGFNSARKLQGSCDATFA
jgi:hypothetical protein